MAKEMHVICAFNEAYKDLAQVLFVSIKKNHKEKVIVHVFEHGLKEGTKHFLTKEYQSPSFQIVFHEVPGALCERFEKLQHDERMSVESYFRFAVLDSSMFDVETDRIMWLDVDTVVRGSLTDFYFQDFGEYSFVACVDRVEKGDAVWEHFHDAIATSEDTPYFNAGVLLIHLDALRKQHTIEELFEFAEQNRDKYMLGDQDLLNHMFAGKIKMADRFRYNFMVRHGEVIPAEIQKQVCEEGCVIHFTHNIKPYERFYENVLVDEFWKYAGCVKTFRYEYWRFQVRRWYRLVKKLFERK